jgi:hypothetical protein
MDASVSNLNPNNERFLYDSPLGEFLPKAFKGCKVSFVGLVITFFQALMTKVDGSLIMLLVVWALYYLIAVIIFKALKKIRDFFTKKK